MWSSFQNGGCVELLKNIKYLDDNNIICYKRTSDLEVSFGSDKTLSGDEKIYSFIINFNKRGNHT